MVFWRKKKNIKEQEQEEREGRLFHRPSEPDLEPPTEYDAEIDANLRHELEQTETEILEELSDYPEADKGKSASRNEQRTEPDDEGGWLSRLSTGLSKSTTKISKGLSDFLTKKKLDQEALDQLEELLIAADLGPKTAAKIIEDFSRDRFGHDISEKQIRQVLADSMSQILEQVAEPLEIKKPKNGPFVIVVCGVNGAGKTTTIGKLAYKLHFTDGLKVTMAAADTFRAAAIDQLKEWSRRASADLYTKDIGDDPAAVAYEAYQQAKDKGHDVLLIDTAGRLHNKANLMEELQKVIRVLKKQDESLPHRTVLVLDSTTGQNAFAQLETFKEMVNVDGLVITKLDGSAKGGVVVGLADKFNIPVHFVGVGEGIEDMQPFSPKDYAQSLLGL